MTAIARIWRQLSTLTKIDAILIMLLCGSLLVVGSHRAYTWTLALEQPTAESAQPSREELPRRNQLLLVEVVVRLGQIEDRLKELGHGWADTVVLLIGLLIAGDRVVAIVQGAGRRK